MIRDGGGGEEEEEEKRKRDGKRIEVIGPGLGVKNFHE